MVGLSDWFGGMLVVNTMRRGGELAYDGVVYATGGSRELQRARARREALQQSYPKVILAVFTRIDTVLTLFNLKRTPK